MFTSKQKEKICQEIYDWDASSFLGVTWFALSQESKTYLLNQVDAYLDKPENTAVLKRILKKFDPEAIDEFEKTLPYSVGIDWERAEKEKQEAYNASHGLPPSGLHMVVSADKTAVSFYTDDEWAEYQKSLAE